MSSKNRLNLLKNNGKLYYQLYFCRNAGTGVEDTGVPGLTGSMIHG